MLSKQIKLIPFLRNVIIYGALRMFTNHILSGLFHKTNTT